MVYFAMGEYMIKKYKKIEKLINCLRITPHQINSIVKFFVKEKIDFDVYLPSKKMNLQRGFVWTLSQQRELIWSILIGRKIPRMAMINTMDDVYQVIDGEQRLSAMMNFYNNGFTLNVEGDELLFKELPIDYQNCIGCFPMPYYIYYEYSEGEVTDQDKIDWFRYINFAGTSQDEEQMKKLREA